jgi:hypothetical protein
VGIEFLAISPRDRSALEKLFDGVEAVITP